jgi:hypothetical protein
LDNLANEEIHWSKMKRMNWPARLAWESDKKPGVGCPALCLFLAKVVQFVCVCVCACVCVCERERERERGREMLVGIYASFLSEKNENVFFSGITAVHCDFESGNENKNRSEQTDK